MMAALFLFVMQSAWGQGSTSSRITGQVVTKSESLIGASVAAVHEPTGFLYGNVTNEKGYFTLNNIKVGGPYTITISYTGFESKEIKDVYLSLGQTETFNVELSESATLLDEVVITAGGLFDGNRTGAETKISTEQLEKLPTANRGFNDYLKVAPQANLLGNGGVSFAGVNNRFNSIFIDGAVNNDVFGLANSGTNGGQAGISPISVDALEQIQIVLAPYDVTLGGFAGGGVNAITRSGSNNFEGSAYYFLRNEGLAGKTPTDNDNATRTKLPDFTAQTFGARLGGPLIKNKLFFFTNVEFQRDKTPRPLVIDQYNGDSGIEQLEAIRNKLQTDFGYDPGEYLNNDETIDGDKVLVKLDWNASDIHKVSLRHSYTKAVTERHGSPNASSIIFGNTGSIFPSTTNSTALEIKSIFNSNISNNLLIGYTSVDDNVSILGDPFPNIIMPDGAGTITAGTFNFGYSNIVRQKVLTITDNFNLYKGNHSFTFGTHNEFYTIENLFTIFSTPRYQYFFNGVNRFLAGENADLVLFGHEQLAPGQSEIRLGDAATNLGPSFNAMQLGFYAQDEIQVNPDFKFTVGLRFDIPIFTDDPPLNNTAFNSTTVPLLEQFYDLEGARASQAPATQILVSPRVGFNWDVNGDKSTQLRGGLGVFTSRVPWVWPGGMFIRNGLNSAFNVSVGVGQQEIYSNPQDWITNLTSSASPTGDVDLFTKDFKYPQIARASLALDKKMPWGLDGTFEMTFTKTLNNIRIKNVNLKPSTGNLSGADNRPTFDFSDKVDPTYTNIPLVSNTNDGYTFNITGQVSKQVENTAFSLAYSFTRATSLFDGTGFINNTNWQRVYSPLGNNNPTVSRSSFDAGSRLTAFLSHTFAYSDNAATNVSLFLTAQSGRPYTFAYNNIISEVSQSAGVTDLIFVPASSADINLVDIDGGPSAAQQWSDLDAFISGNSYLDSRRGDYVEPNRVRTPFETIVDFKLTQDIYFGKHGLQLTLDIFNFTNMINKNWGRRYTVGGDTFPLIQSNLSDTGQPEFNFINPGDTYSIIQSGNTSARWVGQFGIRYSF